jgi:hypothetical protein
MWSDHDEDDEMAVPIGRAVFKFDLNERLPPDSDAGYQALFQQVRFSPACQLQAAMVARGLLARDGWEIVEGFLAFEPEHEDDHEWGLLWVGIGARDTVMAEEVLSNVLREVMEATDRWKRTGDS